MNSLQALMPPQTIQVMISKALITQFNQQQNNRKIFSLLSANILESIIKNGTKTTIWNILWLKICMINLPKLLSNMKKLNIMEFLAQMKANSHIIRKSKNSSNKENIMLITILKFLLIFKDLEIDNFNLFDSKFIPTLTDRM